MREEIKILVVEDDDAINKLLCRLIENNGYISEGAYSGTEAMLYLKQMNFQMVILDLNLPGLRGEEILSFIRQKGDMPVIVISAELSKETKVKALLGGADDYITKPFDLDEVAARIATNLRRAKTSGKSDEESILRYKNIELNEETKGVLVKGQLLNLTAREYGILKLLMENPKKIFSKSNVFQSVWQEEYFGDDNTISVHMSNLRTKISRLDDIEYIETIWGMGYRLKE